MHAKIEFSRVEDVYFAYDNGYYSTYAGPVAVSHADGECLDLAGHVQLDNGDDAYLSKQRTACG